MRTYVYMPACFISLLVICLMFAPARLVTGDRPVYSVPAAIPQFTSPPAAERSFADLCRHDPIGALARSLHNYRRDVEGYTCTFIKQERIDGKLRNREVIRCDFRESPFAVRMEWIEGRDRAAIMLYPAGDRADQLAIVPANEIARKALSYVRRSVNDASVRAAARYPASEFGVNNGTIRLHSAWKAAHDKGMLKTQYDGIQPIAELNGQRCHVLRRDCVVPEEDGLTEVTVYFDEMTLQQVGAVLKAGDQLVATYYFRDLVFNPTFDAAQFSMDRLK
jgi:hypothetical protein